jgi:aminopeptidase N
MENWGFTTFKEQFLIGDENSHPKEIFDIFRITANVYGHQYFGMF